MTATELRRHFISRSPWVDPERTVDTFKAGTPEREVRALYQSVRARLQTIGVGT